MADYTDHAKVIDMLTKAQGVDEDLRDLAAEANNFIDMPDGQWEPGVVSTMDDRPMFTFDMTSGVVDDIAGEIEGADISIKIRPAGGGATDEMAKKYDGIIRNIQNMSNATSIYNTAGRHMVTTGCDGFRIDTGYLQSDSFDQDLLFVAMPNFLGRVWFDPASTKQDKSDANWVVDLQAVALDTYEERFPEGSKQSVSDGANENVYYQKAEFVIVGELLYKKKKKTVLVQMSDGAVYKEDELEPVLDELAEQGITESAKRTVEVDEVHSHFFDGGGWLSKEEKTVFEWLPIIPIYANFKIVENKVIWSGVVQKLMGPQRVLNYAESRKIEEGALAPRAKLYMSEEQAVGHEDTLETLNTNANPVQFYNHIDGQMLPAYLGGAQINQGLMETAATAKQFLQSTSGQVDPSAQSGMFGSGQMQRQLQNKADTGNIKYSKGLVVGINHAARILMNAIPKVYDKSNRQSRVANEDGSSEMVTLNEQVFDSESRKMVILNDLSSGVYNAVADIGPAFKNRQQETSDQMLQLAAIAPGILEAGMDVFLNASDAPKMGILAERIREKMVQSGSIPEGQLTDDEKEALQAAQEAASQQPKEPTPEEKIGQAELQKAEADVADTQSIIQNRQQELELEIERMKIAAEDADEDRKLAYAKLAQVENKQIGDLSLKITELEQKMQMQIDKQMQDNTQALTNNNTA